ncbi:Mak10 domain-containing protein [Rhizoctonia solani AG-1 IA]|uniref:Mak10 domain-containing protein n=1 Tax=Thanatephorus cucumeris (strain AG1-IA) TaxID=983506 RepID=L8X453_THACA|nr:Mak10 domain-containing protein [Rhizoctonia solani AG-1 IA]
MWRTFYLFWNQCVHSSALRTGHPKGRQRPVRGVRNAPPVGVLPWFVGKLSDTSRHGIKLGSQGWVYRAYLRSQQLIRAHCNYARLNFGHLFSVSGSARATAGRLRGDLSISQHSKLIELVANLSAIIDTTRLCVQPCQLWSISQNCSTLQLKLELGQVLFMPNFSLFDAMSAIEIMDPRMDSALVPPGVDPPEVPFTDPNAPLLAEEVCWILDRTMAAEVSHPSLLPTYELYCSRKLTPILKMGWHSGYALSQTLYTSLYIHQIAPVSSHGALPQYFPAWRQDPARPMGLVSIVLQAGLMAIVKTCDWVWRELSGGNVFDVSVFNLFWIWNVWNNVRIPSWRILMQTKRMFLYMREYRFKLSLQTTDAVWKYALHHRIALRKHILLSVSVGQNESSIAERATHVSNALASYYSVRAGPVPGTPPSSSPLHAAFDPTINRRLVVSMPLKVIKLMPTDDAWKALQGMLQGVLETCKALNSVDLLEMMVCITCFIDRILTLHPDAAEAPGAAPCLSEQKCLRPITKCGKLMPPNRWRSRTKPVNPERPVLQLFLSQLLGLSLDDIRALNNLPSGIASLPVSPEDLEESAERVGAMSESIYVNANINPNIAPPPTRLVFVLADWHELWENTIDTALLVRKDVSMNAFRWCNCSLIAYIQPVLQRLRRLPLGILHIKLENIIDLTFAGFETELYGEAEWPLLYWHLSRVLTQQVQTLETLLRLIEADGDPWVIFNLK